MAPIEIVRAVPIDEAALSVEELARACAVEPDWVAQRVRTGVLGPGATAQAELWRFTSADLARAAAGFRAGLTAPVGLGFPKPDRLPGIESS